MLNLFQHLVFCHSEQNEESIIYRIKQACIQLIETSKCIRNTFKYTSQKIVIRDPETRSG